MTAPPDMRRDGVPEHVNAISGDVVDAAIRVHAALGPGLLERPYLLCLAAELRARGRQIETEVAMPLVYRGATMETGYRFDMRVEGLVIVEAKAVEALTKIHVAQLMTYLKLSGAPVGLLINFNSVPLHRGIQRFVGPATRGGMIRGLPSGRERNES